jgi:serine/threonine protein phosphatase PrpC
VLSRLGRAIELTRDHKPHEPQERARIVSSGGFVCEQGRLGGELSVARALGDHHLPQLKQPPAAAGQGG